MIRNRLSLVLPAFGLLLCACGTTMSGHVVMPDGSRLKSQQVVVYTSPRTETVKAGKDGSFKINDNVVDGNDYTIMAEDQFNNIGYVRSFKPRKGSNKNILVRLSKEVEGKDAILEGGPMEVETSGVGEKILKSSP